MRILAPSQCINSKIIKLRTYYHHTWSLVHKFDISHNGHQKNFILQSKKMFLEDIEVA